MNTSPKTETTCSASADNDKRKKDRSLGYFHGEAAAGAVENASIAYQNPSLIASGAEAQGVALLSTLTNLVFSLLYLKMPAIIGRLGPTQKAVFAIAFVSAVTWLPLIFVPLFWGAIPSLALALLWIINVIPAIVDAPLRDSWLADIVPAKGMGRYFGIRSAISSAAYLGTFYLMGYILDNFQGKSFGGFAIVFAIGLAACLASVALYRRIRPPAAAAFEKREEFGITDFARETRQGNLGGFIVYVSVFGLAVSLSGPLFSVYMLSELKFSYLTFTMILSSEYVARILSNAFWGRCADKYGSLRIMGIVSRLIPCIPLLWLFSHNVGYLVIVQFFSGLVWAGYDLCSQTFIYKAAPQSRRLGYIICHKSLSSLAVALGTLAGAYLLSVMVPVFQSRILGLFLLSGIARFIVVGLMFHKLVDMVPPVEQGQPQVKVVRPVPEGRGLLHQPAIWAFFSEPLPAQKSPAAQSSVLRKAFLHEPQEWPAMARESARTSARAQKALPRQAVFYSAEEWASYRGETAIAKAASPKQDIRRVTLKESCADKPGHLEAKPSDFRKALYHETQEWVQFLRRSDDKTRRQTAPSTGLTGQPLRLKPSPVLA